MGWGYRKYVPTGKLSYCTEIILQKDKSLFSWIFFSHTSNAFIFWTLVKATRMLERSSGLIPAHWFCDNP